jgi:hypothetical protein
MDFTVPAQTGNACGRLGLSRAPGARGGLITCLPLVERQVEQRLCHAQRVVCALLRTHEIHGHRAARRVAFSLFSQGIFLPPARTYTILT